MGSKKLEGEENSGRERREAVEGSKEGERERERERRSERKNGQHRECVYQSHEAEQEKSRAPFFFFFFFFFFLT